ncbi:Mbeg1-like protein [uncultured Desulfobulbus sp.]|uniref:lipase family protein n=1 Tax=uncultured Desulfobulbus sp. TaxID=239745 RepID=UPI0029C78493|nr:Mbeg1-like protein [uncultured Desulfobulbus sp.]
MATEIELAVMAGRAYQSTRDRDTNWFPAPDPETWTEMEHTSEPSGFEAVYFQRGTGANKEIVISFAGTYDKDNMGDIATDIALGAGLFAMQLLQAAEYYLQVKAENPDVQITLAGHSLGGGLAALVGVFFGVNAVTFDQAPFRKTAECHYPESPNNDPCAVLLSVLQYNQIDQSLLQPLEEYVAAMRQGYLGVLQDREDDVWNIRVDGEFLSGIFPVSKVDFIGTTSPADVLTHGATDLSGI